jgi:hypothetical protein
MIQASLAIDFELCRFGSKLQPKQIETSFSG